MFGRQADAYLTSEFAAYDTVKISRGIQSSSIAACFPFVSNAVDATAGLRQPEIRITTVGVRRPDGKIEAVRVVVEDNGPGFSANILSCAFEPYTTTKPTGTGLGLPMVKKIIEEHHGRISIGNRTDLRGAVLGARIVIVLPLSQAATSQDAAPGKIPNMLG